ncbi:MAG: hypothetical protein JWP80_4617 [Pseudomonas sp.]|nr:hypothetical protein [Pseudomonas sp.]
MIRKSLTTLAFATLLSAVSAVTFAATPTDTVDPMASPSPTTTHKKTTHKAKTKADTTNTSHVPGAKGGNANGNDQSPSTGTGAGGGVNSGTKNEIQ